METIYGYGNKCFRCKGLIIAEWFFNADFGRHDLIFKCVNCGVRSNKEVKYEIKSLCSSSNGNS